MSTAASTVNQPTPSAADQLIDQRIEEARRALWWSELTRTVLMVAIGSMLALLCWLVMDHWIYSPGPFVRALCFTSMVVCAFWFFFRRAWPVMTSNVTSEYAAWALEKDHSDYRQTLTSYVTLKKDTPQRGVRRRVVGVIGARAASLLKSHDSLPDEATGTFRWWIAAAAVFAILAAYCVASPKSSFASAKRLLAPIASIDPAKRVQIVDVQPGNSTVLAGRVVEVSAEVMGLRDDELVFCRWSSDGPARESELVFDSDADRFVGKLDVDHSASGNVRYTIEAGDAVAGPFWLDVENVPVVAIESIRYQPPAYTRRKTRTTTSPSITAIDGTKIRITAKTNRRVRRAELQFNSKHVGDTVRYTGGKTAFTIDDDGVTLVADITLRCARERSSAVELENYRVRVWDSNEQSNPDPIIYPIKVIADLPPEVAIVVPTKSPIEVPVSAQQIIEVHAMDADFELERMTLKIERGINTIDNPVIWVRPKDGSGKGNHVAEYRFRPLDHRLVAGDVVRVFATAFDNRSLPGDSKVSPNEAKTDHIEIRIVEDQAELPEDPTGNDGLSRPDERPASDVTQPENDDSASEGAEGENSGGENSGGENSGGENSGGENSGGENSGGENSGGENSGGENSGGENSGGENSGGENSGGENSGGENSGGENSGGENSGGENSGGENSGGENSGGENSGGENSGGENSGGENSGGENSGGENSGGENSGGEKSGGENSGGENSGGENSGGEKSGGENSGGENSGGNTRDGGKQGSSGESARNQSSGNQSTGESGTGQNGDGSQGPSKGSPAKEAPKHDGEAFERIKDYIENKERSQNENATGSKEGDTGANNDSPSNDQPSGSKSGDPESAGQKEADSDSEKSDSGQQGSSAENPSGKQDGQTSESSQDKPQAGDQGTGDQQQQASGKGDPKASESESDGHEESDSGESGEQSDNADRGNSQADGSSSGPAAKSGDPSKRENEASDGSDGSNDSTSSNTGQPPSSDPRSAKTSSGGEGGGSGTEQDVGDDSAQPPPPPDLEYAKEATDMVLDYLDETRDQVDQNLLDNLDWSQEDLARFRDRWKKARELDRPSEPSVPSNEFEDALRSLGLQKNPTPSRSASGSADSIRDLRDSGNRRKAPPAIRDAFDAFRRRR